MVVMRALSRLCLSNRRLPWLLLAWSSLGLGMVGLVLPLLPTTPLVLLAAWAAARGSPALHRWLHQHPRFGPGLRAWREQGAVAPRAKFMAVVALAGSWWLLWRSGAATPVLFGLALLFSCVAGFILTRPRPSTRRGH